jgi:hypothetical protein
MSYASCPPSTVIIHGGARGADRIAGEVAMALGFVIRVYPADWVIHGKAAGPIRNSEMLRKEHYLEEPIDLCLAFTWDLAISRGTHDMVQKARKAHIEVQLPFAA